MVTVPRSRMTLREILRLFKIINAEKWIIGKEKGKDGYKHWQIRYKRAEYTSTQHEQSTWSSYGGHVIRAETQDWSYEAKSGNYMSSWERDVAFIKHGNLTRTQASVIRMLKASGRPEKEKQNQGRS